MRHLGWIDKPEYEYIYQNGKQVYRPDIQPKYNIITEYPGVLLEEINPNQSLWFRDNRYKLQGVGPTNISILPKNPIKIIMSGTKPEILLSGENQIRIKLLEDTPTMVTFSISVIFKDKQHADAVTLNFGPNETILCQRRTYTYRYTRDFEATVLFAKSTPAETEIITERWSRSIP